MIIAIATFAFGALVGAVVDRLAFERAVLVTRDEQGRVIAVKGTYKVY